MSAPTMDTLPEDVEERELVEMDTSSNEGHDGGHDSVTGPLDDGEQEGKNDNEGDDEDGENEEDQVVENQTGPPTKNVDAELEAMKKRLQQMEQETMAMHGEEDGTVQEGNQGATPSAGAAPVGVDASKGQSGAPATGAPVDEATADSDARSIYVGNVCIDIDSNCDPFSVSFALLKLPLVEDTDTKYQYFRNKPFLVRNHAEIQVDYKATGEELNQYFQDCGTINRVTIMCHKATGQPKGYAYIEFKERESVQNALILNESQFRGRQIKVVEKRTNIPGVSRGGFARGRGRFSRGWRGPVRGRPRSRGRGRARWAPY